MKIGYARISTEEQTLESQIDLLKKHGCKKVFSDRCTGSYFNRESLNEMLKYIRNEEDELVIYSYDRLGRNTEESIKLVKELLQRKIKITVLSDHTEYNLQSATGMLNFQIGRVIDEYHNNRNKENTIRGLRYAREAGRIGGRPKKLTEENKKVITSLYLSNEIPISKICEMFKIGNSTFYDNIKVSKLTKESGRKVGRKKKESQIELIQSEATS